MCLWADSALLMRRGVCAAIPSGIDSSTWDFREAIGIQSVPRKRQVYFPRGFSESVSIVVFASLWCSCWR
jgi:hypothetical protein